MKGIVRDAFFKGLLVEYTKYREFYAKTKRFLISTYVGMAGSIIGIHRDFFAKMPRR